MTASIHSQDDVKDSSPGKTQRVSCDSISIRCHGRSLHLTAEDSEFYCPRESSSKTAMRDIQRTFRLELSQKELKQILDAALKANLLQASFAIADLKRK